MAEVGDNPIVLSFHETLLRNSDIDLLRGPHWLNDNLISFYFEYLEKLVYTDDSGLLFISPEVTQCLKISPAEELRVFLDPLNWKQKAFIFMALNDCDTVESPGGSHWSLLVYSKPENGFFHLDSSRGSNFKQAWRLAENLLKIFSPSGTGEYKEQDALQQTNSYDCGIHVICNAYFVAEHCRKSGKVEDCPKIEESEVTKKRSELLRLILTLRDEEEKINK